MGEACTEFRSCLVGWMVGQGGREAAGKSSLISVLQQSLEPQTLGRGAGCRHWIMQEGKLCGESQQFPGSILHILLLWDLAVFTLLSKVLLK